MIVARHVLCITPPRTADRTFRDREGEIAFLHRSTSREARRIRRFLNGNVAAMPAQARQALCSALKKAGQFSESILELIVGRTLQELGARELQYEPIQARGRRPDYLAVFADNSVFVDARHPDWHRELGRQRRAHQRLLDIVEQEIPPGWSFLAVRLPRIGLAEKTTPFRRAVRATFTTLPAPTMGTRLLVSSAYPAVSFELELRAPRLADWRAWLGGPGTAAFTAPEARIVAALKAKRGQLAGLPHPAIVALGGALGASIEDYEIALFGRTFAQLDGRGREVARGFHRSGVFAQAGSGGAPTIAAVLAYTGMDLTVGRDPVLFVHPRLRRPLPGALLQLETHTLAAAGPQARPATVRDVFARISATAAGR